MVDQGDRIVVDLAVNPSFANVYRSPWIICHGDQRACANRFQRTVAVMKKRIARSGNEKGYGYLLRTERNSQMLWRDEKYDISVKQWVALCVDPSNREMSRQRYPEDVLRILGRP